MSKSLVNQATADDEKHPAGYLLKKLAGMSIINAPTNTT
jgi:hypothetical protein